METTREDMLHDFLVAGGIIAEADWNDALAVHRSTNEPLNRILVNKGYLTDEESCQLSEILYGAPFVHLDRYILDKEALLKVPEDIARKRNVIPMYLDGADLVMAFGNPTDVATIDYLKGTTLCNIRVVYAHPSDIDNAQTMYYNVGMDIQNILEALSRRTENNDLLGEGEEAETRTMRELAEEAPIVLLVNMSIIQAVESRASDIHIEGGNDDSKIKYRIDGILHLIQRFPAAIHRAVISRIKILGGMDIAERRLPQDGRCTVRIKDRIVDLRISVAPFVMGEKCVIRILEQKQSFVKLENLGFSGDSFGKFTDMIDKPYGMVLVTGPTGSGKSTTLYAALNELNTGTKNISTIEDPVEYQIDGLNQMQILPRIELTFSAALRSFLRQDPDIIMVGEVRDRETAEIAVQAALTGHLVLSTIHTKNTVGALVRLIDMGIPPFLVASSVNGIVSQRLLRRLCPRCTSELDVTPEMEKTLSASPYPITKFRRGKGCEMCKGTGYYGRTAIYEVLKVSQRLSRAVRANADSSALLEIAREEGLVTLNEAAWEKVRDGVTSPEEVLRMTLCLEDSA